MLIIGRETVKYKYHACGDIEGIFQQKMIDTWSCRSFAVEKPRDAPHDTIFSHNSQVRFALMITWYIELRISIKHFFFPL
jgi:hypothetical protein